MKTFLTALLLAISAILAVSPHAAGQDETAFQTNLDCYFALANLGIFHGFADDEEARRAGFAMGEVQRRYRDEAARLEMGNAAMTARERAAQNGMADAVDQWKAGGKDKGLGAFVSGCFEAADGPQTVERNHADFARMTDETRWCHGVLRFLDAMEMVGGGEPRIARVRTAMEVLDGRLRYDAGLHSVPAEDLAVLVEAAWQRAVVQGHRFNWTGERSAFERDYHTCLRWSEAAAIPNPFAPEAGGPAIGDPWTIYNVGVELQAYYRCQAALMHAQAYRPDEFDSLRTLEVLAYVGREIAAEVTARDIAPDVRAAMAEASRARAEAIYAALDAGTYDGPEGELPDYCFFLDWEDWAEEALDALFGPAD